MLYLKQPLVAFFCASTIEGKTQKTLNCICKWKFCSHARHIPSLSLFLVSKFSSSDTKKETKHQTIKLEAILDIGTIRVANENWV